ncbi:MAG: hypothetical protein R3179_07610, partial [Sedimenticolaceae bacterium]|nr:hypothetical protein [Sedimenticolaceae bacterium]
IPVLIIFSDEISHDYSLFKKTRFVRIPLQRLTGKRSVKDVSQLDSPRKPAFTSFGGAIISLIDAVTGHRRCFIPETCGRLVK